MKRVIDYRAAAERLLDVLAAGATEHKPLPAVELAHLIFDADLCAAWKDDESRRRRVRDAAIEARKLLKERRQDPVPPPPSPAAGTEDANVSTSALIGDGRGYWLSADPGVIAWYARRRQSTGKQNFAAAGSAKAAAAAVHQPSLFPPLPSQTRRI